MKRLLVRIKLKGSDIVFSPGLPPGVLVVAQIILEKPERLDETLHTVKLDMLNGLFELDYTPADVSDVPLEIDTNSRYLQ